MCCRKIVVKCVFKALNSVSNNTDMKSNILNTQNSAKH